ncbi:MAG: FlgD immunoglobulin-like domain containing protein [Candidatus Krumholzibacteriia bacterium]
MPRPIHRTRAIATVAGLLALVAIAGAQDLGTHVVLVCNDLGMHCMNQSHQYLSVLPPYNDLQAQVILRGDATRLPQILVDGVSLEYSIPGNTYSVGKTDFWDYDLALFGVDLPPDIGLTGKGLDDVFDAQADRFRADGIPLTPFTDAQPTVEDPYQVAQVILRDAFGTELARAYPVMPVSVELTCVTSGCHASEQAILFQHEDEDGFDPNDTPILCASCHGSTPLTGPNPGPHGWFSRRMHHQHDFIDETIPGQDGCYMCHPGPNTRCLRGTMATDHGMVCQDCHGNMAQVANSISAGRVPWVDEPACRTCHTATYGEPVGELYRNATGHGGVMCSLCHNSPHAIFPSREARDNRVMEDLQGHAGTLSDCTVCHGVVPGGAGPHGVVATGVVEAEVFAAPGRLRVFPSPAQTGTGCTVMAASRRPESGRLLVFDVRGRTVRMLRADGGSAGGDVALVWDGRDASGRDVASGTYFLRWDDGQHQAAGKVVMVR